MYSVSVPVPGRVRALATDLYPSLTPFETVVDDHSCLLKRLGDADHVSHLQQRVHRTLEGAPAVEARISGIDYFEAPPLGPAPVVYLAVESPGLEAIHDTLCSAFDPIEGLEGPDYVPHVTLARGGSLETARQLSRRRLDSVTWTVSELVFFDGRYRQPVSRISLPA